MEFAKTIAQTFGIALLATLAIAAIARLGGNKPNWRQMIAIATGLTIGKISEIEFSLSPGVYAFVLAASISVCVLVVRPWRFAERAKSSN